MERRVDKGITYFGWPSKEVEKYKRFVCEVCHRDSVRQDIPAHLSCNEGKWNCLDPSIVWMSKLEFITLKLEA